MEKFSDKPKMQEKKRRLHISTGKYVKLAFGLKYFKRVLIFKKK
jgi:hypothetical protein